jgi:predicted nucleotidyltransferase
LPSLLKAVKETLPDAEVYVFGSALRNELTANSDVDALIVSDSVAGRQHHRVAAVIEERLETPFIFEMHFATRDKMEWYGRHAKNLVPAEKFQ